MALHRARIKRLFITAAKGQLLPNIYGTQVCV